MSHLHLTNSPQTHHSPTILVAEGNDDYRAFLALTLRHNGYRVEEAADGNAVIDYLTNVRAPCLLLINLNVTGCSCAQVLQQIRAIPSLAALPVVALGNDSSLQAQAMAVLATDFLPQSLSGMKESLLAKVQTYCPLPFRPLNPK